MRRSSTASAGSATSQGEGRRGAKHRGSTSSVGSVGSVESRNSEGGRPSTGRRARPAHMQRAPTTMFSQVAQRLRLGLAAAGETPVASLPSSLLQRCTASSSRCFS
jgi:hypothetical protein